MVFRNMAYSFNLYRFMKQKIQLKKTITWYKKSWLWTIIYQVGDTIKKKKQFFSNVSFPVLMWKYKWFVFHITSVCYNDPLLRILHHICKMSLPNPCIAVVSNLTTFYYINTLVHRNIMFFSDYNVLPVKY